MAARGCDHRLSNRDLEIGFDSGGLGREGKIGLARGCTAISIIDLVLRLPTSLAPCSKSESFWLEHGRCDGLEGNAKGQGL